MLPLKFLHGAIDFSDINHQAEKNTNFYQCGQNYLELKEENADTKVCERIRVSSSACKQNVLRQITPAIEHTAAKSFPSLATMSGNQQFIHPTPRPTSDEKRRGDKFSSFLLSLFLTYLKRLLAVGGRDAHDLKLRHPQLLGHDDRILGLPLQTQLFDRLGNCTRDDKKSD
jgi:hypothetical protein